ncbi:MAG TPA: ATP-binding protein [Dehalococcoidia bacterium]|nr:ATP-binding protein [Dehalococcoidia bacterium]
MLFPQNPHSSERDLERSFGAVDLLQLVLGAMRPSLDFDIAVAVLCEDGRHVLPIYATGALSPGVVEGVHVQALAAFVELAGQDHASWPADEPRVIQLGGDERALSEPDAYEDAPLVVDGAVAGMLRVSTPRPLDKLKRDIYFAMASDVSKAIERLDAQRSQTRLVQERLLQSEKMSSVGQLVSGVAHELNNPLTGIMGFAQLLLLRELDDTARRQVETIYAEAERASKIVSNLLTFARRRKAQKESANLNTLIDRVLELRNYDLRVRNIDIALDMDPDLPETMLDTNQVQQVLLNIIINAEQAMRSEGGEGRLRISTRAQRGAVVASFADSGPGMSAETLRRIFDPFFTTKDAGEGTGLGLTISYGIIEDHGGRIWAESEPGRGTTFLIELPMLSAGNARAEPEAPSPPASPEAPRAGRRVLVVDDEDSIKELLTNVLEMDHHEVVLASNGREALDLVRSQPFDLIVSDVKMPIMGGAELYQRLRDEGHPLASRLIFVTGDTVAAETRAFLQGVPNPVLSKPFRLRDVRETVQSVLDR